MARKRTAAGTDRHGANSSKAPPAKRGKKVASTFENDKERTEKEPTRKAVLHRKIVPERFFPPNLELKFWKMCQAMHYSELIGQKVSYNRQIVQEYSIERQFNNRLYLKVRGTDVELDDDSIREFLKIPPSSQPCSFDEFRVGRLSVSVEEVEAALYVPNVIIVWASTKRHKSLSQGFLSLEGRC